MIKPFSQACVNNREPILAVIRNVWTQPCTVLEIGSGTGQHAVYFAEHLPHLVWQPSDRAQHIAGMQLWFDDAGFNNLLSPLVLDVEEDDWPLSEMEAVFTANTLHIMSWYHVSCFFRQLGRLLQPHGVFVSYGPFNKNGDYTSDSNARFDLWLKQQDAESAIRHLEELVQLAADNNLSLLQEIDMPANNKILVWQAHS